MTIKNLRSSANTWQQGVVIALFSLSALTSCKASKTRPATPASPAELAANAPKAAAEAGSGATTAAPPPEGHLYLVPKGGSHIGGLVNGTYLLMLGQEGTPVPPHGMLYTLGHLTMTPITDSGTE